MLKIKVARLLGGVEEEAWDRELLHRLSSGDGPARCLVGVRCALLFPDRPRVHENVVAERLQGPAVRRLAAVQLEECMIVLIDEIDGVPIASPQVVDTVILLRRASNLQRRHEIQSRKRIVDR